eukprot:8748013-Lingulodinium_polyedra.AAC.1
MHRRPPARAAELAQHELTYTHPFTRTELALLAREEGGMPEIISDADALRNCPGAIRLPESAGRG